MANTSAAEQYKLKGNQFFKQCQYQDAVHYYTEAIKCDPSNAVLYSNRAIAYIKLQDYLRAEKDCDKAIELNPLFDKAYFRRGLARKALHRYRSSLNDFRKVLELTPNTTDVKNEIESIENVLRSTIRIDPINKSEDLASKIPLKNVDIVRDVHTLMETDGDPLENQIYYHLKKQIKGNQPKNYVDFERFWRELKTTDLKIEFIENIDPSAFQNIFEYPFEPKLLFDLISVLEKCPKLSSVYRILEAMTKMPRFTLNFTFLSQQEYQVLKNLFIKLMNCDEISRSDVFDLARKFNVEI